MLSPFYHFSQSMKKLIFLLIPIISFAQEDSSKTTTALDYLYPKKDLVFQYQDD